MFHKHGLDDDAHRERELILKTGSFLSWDVCNANRLRGEDENAHGDYLAAADSWERAFLGNLAIQHVVRGAVGKCDDSGDDPQGARHGPDQGKRRGRVARSAGRAQRFAERRQRPDRPCPVSFEKAGRKAQADALFTPTAKVYQQLCEEYPGSGPAHNQLAWVEARCHRDLDDALKHARRAVEVEPTNVTASIDTLAEV